MLNLTGVEVVADINQDDASVELCIEADGPEGLLLAKLYFADREYADRFASEIARANSAPSS